MKADPVLVVMLLSLLALLAGAEVMLVVKGRKILARDTWWGFFIRCGLWILLMLNTLIGLFYRQFLSDVTEITLELCIVGFFLFALYDRWREEKRAATIRDRLRQRERELEEKRAESERHVGDWNDQHLLMLF